MPSPLGDGSISGPSRAPNSPPPELQQNYVTAQKVAAGLEARQVNVHFGVDATGRVRVELIGGSGEVLREIPATHLLDALSGCGELEGV
ncbi:MAG: hypothetical protein ABJB93_08840 [Gaiellales bacterium]